MIFVRKSFKSVKMLLSLLTFWMPSFLRVPVLRLLGFKIGKGVKIAAFSIIAAKEAEIGNDVLVCPFAVMFNLKRIKLGNKVYISSFTTVHSLGLGSLTLGDFTATGLFSFIDCTCDVSVGRYSCVGPRNMLSTHGNFLPKTLGFSNRFGAIKIGDYAWLMMDVKVTSGVTIGNFVIAHAGTVITTDIPDNSIYTYNRDSFKTLPMNAVYRKNVTKEYIDRWRDTLFSDLGQFVKDYFNVDLSCIKEDNCWILNVSNKITKIWVEDSIGGSDSKKFAPNDIIIYFSAQDRQRLKELRNLNWLDLNLNLYNQAGHSLLFAYIIFYFEIKYGIKFTLYEA